MQELEKILEEMKKIKNGNRKEKLYAKYPPNSKEQKALNAYSQGYEDGTDNFYNAMVDIIRKHMNDRPCSECSRRKFYQAGYRDGKTDGWIPVEERLPEKYISVLVQWEKYDRHLNVTLTYLDVMWLEDEEDVVFETTNGVPNGKVIAWRPLPEPYFPERSEE